MNLLTEENLIQLKEDGYIIIPNFYNINEILKMRKIILYNAFVKKNLLFMGDKSGSKPDFLKDNDYKELTSLLKLNEIHHLMKQIFNAPFHFCQHNDIGINRIVHWHKDTLNNQYKKYQKTNIWGSYNNEKHEIYKCLIYLQDHNNNIDGLTIIKKSHLIPNIVLNDKNNCYISSKIGDIIIFDQRITHRGQQNNNNHSIDRILISLGFGKNNIFTKEFEEGTQERQKDQNRLIKK